MNVENVYTVPSCGRWILSRVIVNGTGDLIGVIFYAVDEESAMNSEITISYERTD